MLRWRLHIFAVINNMLFMDMQGMDVKCDAIYRGVTKNNRQLSTVDSVDNFKSFGDNLSISKNALLKSYIALKMSISKQFFPHNF